MEDDLDRRLQICEIMFNMIEEDSAILNNIARIDKASFKLSGHVNRHNCICWYCENKHFTIEQQLNHPGVNVRGGISSFGVTGPICFLMEQ